MWKALSITTKTGTIKFVMTSRVRWMIYLAFLAAFFVTAPIIVLFTAGYRYSPERHGFVRSGLLSVTSVPKDARVVVDGKAVRETTPVLIDDLLPGEHAIEIQKDGYATWRKTLRIEESETTFVQRATLFLEEDPTMETLGLFLDAAFDPSARFVAFAKQETGWIEIWARELGSDEKRLLLRLPEQETDDVSLSWSPDGDALLVEQIHAGISTWTYTSADGTSRVSLDEPEDWMSDASLFLQPEGGQLALVRRQSEDISKTLALIPPGDYHFLPSPNHLVLLMDDASSKLLLIDATGADQPILLHTSAVSAVWNLEKNVLLYSTGFELHLYDAQKHVDEVLTRVSHPISEVAWHPAETSVFFVEEKELFAIELDRRDRRNVFLIAEMEELTAFAISSNAKVAYLFGTGEAGEGLYVKRLQEK